MCSAGIHNVPVGMYLMAYSCIRFHKPFIKRAAKDYSPVVDRARRTLSLEGVFFCILGDTLPSQWFLVPTILYMYQPLLQIEQIQMFCRKRALFSARKTSIGVITDIRHQNAKSHTLVGIWVFMLLVCIFWTPNTYLGREHYTFTVASRGKTSYQLMIYTLILGFRHFSACSENKSGKESWIKRKTEACHNSWEYTGYIEPLRGCCLCLGCCSLPFRMGSWYVSNTLIKLYSDLFLYKSDIKTYPCPTVVTVDWVNNLNHSLLRPLWSWCNFPSPPPPPKEVKNWRLSV
jgi:hypothetical protein